MMSTRRVQEHTYILNTSSKEKRMRQGDEPSPWLAHSSTMARKQGHVPGYNASWR